MDLEIHKTKTKNIEDLLSLWSIREIFDAANAYTHYHLIKEKIDIVNGKEINLALFPWAHGETEEKRKAYIMEEAETFINQMKENNLPHHYLLQLESYEELKDSPILDKYKAAYDFENGIDENGNRLFNPIVRWGDSHKLKKINKLILSVIMPDDFQGDSDCIEFELTKEDLEKIINKAKSTLNLNNSYINSRVMQLEAILKKIDFEKEFLFYQPWY